MTRHLRTTIRGEIDAGKRDIWGASPSRGSKKVKGVPPEGGRGSELQKNQAKTEPMGERLEKVEAQEKD